MDNDNLLSFSTDFEIISRFVVNLKDILEVTTSR